MKIQEKNRRNKITRMNRRKKDQWIRRKNGH